ncbi:P68 family surface lipoprotein [Mycoplasma miroungirhinis]|uniref:Lipoprotein n=1 Tax=Mycoplasma miroungirhinis TaxID=754516 RepID=A0A6M4JE03_9MOLU|nr:hypothetical protein [Mycoplasma miroungirhinis]QJR44259.1 hypothetical protein HLA92_02325 [Mycoplasma miroungirhinis]
MKKLNKIKTLLYLSGAVVSIATTAALVSCTTPAKESETVKFSFAQGADWPLPRTLSQLTDYYNKTHADKENFKKVELLTQDKTKTYSELKLAQNIREQYKSGQSEDVPNIFLGNQAGAYIMNQNGILLNLNNQGINKELFASKIADKHSILPGETDHNRLYNIPLSNFDEDATIFNLDLMNLIFNLIKEGKGTVDENSEIYKEALVASKTGNSVPSFSIFSALRLKKADAFANLHVNDETFSSIQSIREFSKEFYDGVEIDESKVTDDTLDGEILSIDYQKGTFYKELNALEDNESNFVQNENGK